MYLPRLRSRKTQTEKQVVAFGGVHYGEGAGDGQLSESRNMTSENFPAMAPRAGRSTEAGFENATAVYYKNGQFVVNGTELLYNGEVIANVTEGKKQFATVNTKVVVLPDKIMFDTATGEVRNLGAEYISEAGMVEFLNTNTIALHQGKYYTKVVATGNIGGTGTTSENKPALRHWDRFVKYTGVTVNAETGALALNGQTTTPIAKVYDDPDNLNVSSRYVVEGTIFTKVYKSDRLGATGQTLFEIDPEKQWAVVTKVYKYQYIKPGSSVSGVEGYTGYPYYGFDYEVREVAGESYETFAGFEALGFRVGDAVEIEGLTTFPEENGSYIIRGFGEHITSDGTKLPTIIFDNDVFEKTGTDAGAVTIRRKVPNLTVVTESSNRLWGADGNTIFASALGDPTNFYTYDGLDTDSYAVAVASEGAFTGCCGFGNSVLFWKEDRLHKILGAYPSQYTMYEYNVPGVKRGSEGSLVNINEVLYYHGRDGVYRYNGGTPDLITENFGLRRFKDASAGAVDGRYYISMQDTRSEEWGLWAYDTQHGIWLREDESHSVDFAIDDGKLFCIADGKLMCLNPEESDEVVAWSATSARMDETYHNRKCYSRLLLRGELLEDQAWLQVDISCDGEPFKRVYTSRDKAAKTLVIPILPKRCDNFRIRLSGEGKCIIRSMVREFGLGSEY